MYEPTQDATWVHGIDLAQEANFDLGFLRVRPAKCEVEWNGASQILQRRVMQVLVVLAHARGAVISRDVLVMRCWRGLSVSDDAIFRCISKLRKLAAGYPAAPYEIETIPGVGYRLTSSGFAEDDPAVEPAAPGESRFRVSPLVVVTALLVLIVAGAALWMSLGRAPDHHALRVAVHPFETLSDFKEARSLARRIPNEVVDALGDSQIEAVLVGEQPELVATSSAGPAAGLIVTGILRDDGHNAIVDVRIEDGATRAALWSTEFKRGSREASDLPFEVAARVADVVNMTHFARNANPPLTDNSALTALLQTTDMIRDAHGGAWAPMVKNAQDLVARHPEFAFGHSVLAAAYAEAADSINIAEHAQAMRDAARREANLTLKLDPQDAGAYAVLWGIEAPYNYQAQEVILLSGIKLAKHPQEPLGALYSYQGTLLSNIGRLREALSFQLIARATDEWGPSKTAKLALNYVNMGNLPAAKGWFQKALQRWPNHSGVRRVGQYIAGFYEPPEKGLAMIKAMDAQRSPDDDQTAIWRSFIEARAAQFAPVRAATIPKIREAADQSKIPRETEIMMLAGLGEPMLAIEAANSALDKQQLQAWFLFTPITRNIRQDPGFVGLAARMGLISYWRETGKWPDFCTDRAKRSECSAQLLAALQAN